MAHPALELTGKQFGYLTVLKRHGTTSGATQKATWLCLCDCGTEVVRESQSLRSRHRPNARHCGCRHGSLLVQHGMSETRPYRIWQGMRERCTNPADKDYPNYGGRGIGVCAPWLESFQNFWNDMRHGYEDNLTLGRVRNSGPYSPENCRWETGRQQSNNKRNNVIVETPMGQMTLTQAARAYGLAVGTLHARIYRYKWDVQTALSTASRLTSKTQGHAISL